MCKATENKPIDMKLLTIESKAYGIIAATI